MTRNSIYRVGYGFMVVAFHLRLKPLYWIGATICNTQIARNASDGQEDQVEEFRRRDAENRDIAAALEAEQIVAMSRKD